MKAGRRNMKQGALEGCPEPQPGEALMRVVSLRGSNLMEVEDFNGQKTLCMLPAKFRKSMWIKTGNFVLVEEGDREKATEAGNKVTGTIVQVLYEEHVRALRKTSFWPPSFLDSSEKVCITPDSSEHVEDSNRSPAKHDGDGEDGEDEESDEDGLPPLEANLNRQQPKGLYHESDSDSNSE